MSIATTTAIFPAGNAHLDLLLDHSLVRLTSDAGKGTGFYVGKNLVLTAAHCLGFKTKEKSQERRYELPAHLKLTCKGKDVQALEIIDVKIDEYYEQSDLSWPDLALIRVRESGLAVQFDEHRLEPGDNLYVRGFPARGQGIYPTSGTFVGMRSDPCLIQIDGAQIREGVSGAPVVNLRTLRVCGIVVRLTDKDLLLGGSAVSASTLSEHLPILQRLEQESVSPSWDLLQPIPPRTDSVVGLESLSWRTFQREVIEMYSQPTRWLRGRAGLDWVRALQLAGQCQISVVLLTIVMFAAYCAVNVCLGIRSISQVLEATAPIRLLYPLSGYVTCFFASVIFGWVGGGPQLCNPSHVVARSLWRPSRWLGRGRNQPRSVAGSPNWRPVLRSSVHRHAASKSLRFRGAWESGLRNCRCYCES